MVEFVCGILRFVTHYYLSSLQFPREVKCPKRSGLKEVTNVYGLIEMELGIVRHNRERGGEVR